MHLADRQCIFTHIHRRAQVYTLRSALPVGAGLGSSAAYSVSLASALLYTHAHVPLPTSSTIDASVAGVINRWAFVGEQILHGTPSGVDNTVSTYGGALGYRKPSSQDRLTSFAALDFLVTDTRVSRDTRALVAGVAARKAVEPDFIQSLLDEIEGVTLEAEQSFDHLGPLMARCHRLLCALGVGHASLETVCTLAAGEGVMSKLTGAGGGGCAISLLPPGMLLPALSSHMSCFWLVLSDVLCVGCVVYWGRG